MSFETWWPNIRFRAGTRLTEVAAIAFKEGAAEKEAEYKTLAEEVAQLRKARLDILQEAAEIECDYCGGRAFQSTGKEIPFQYPNDKNWYHREVSPCKAAPIQHVLVKLRALLTAKPGGRDA